MKLTAHHHVFSSLGGYKTLFASKALSPDLVRDLEVFARRNYTRLKGAPIQAVLRLQDGGVQLTRIFSAGADHVGRPRTAVHNVLLDGDDVRLIPLFNPLLIDADPFLRGDSDMGSASMFVREHLEIDPAIFTRLEVLQQAPRRAEDVRLLLRGMLAPDRHLVIRDPRDDAFGLLRELVTLLPPGVRGRYGVVRGAALSRVCDSGEPVRATFLPAYVDPETFASDEQNIVIDWNAEGGTKVTGLPSPTPYGEFLEDRLLDRPQPPLVTLLLAFQEKHDPGVEHSNDSYFHLLSSFQKLEDRLDAYGQIQWDKLQAEFPDGLELALPLARAGLCRLSLELVDYHAGWAEARIGAEAVANLRRPVRNALQTHVDSNTAAKLASEAVGLIRQRLREAEQAPPTPSPSEVRTESELSFSLPLPQAEADDDESALDIDAEGIERLRKERKSERRTASGVRPEKRPRPRRRGASQTLHFDADLHAFRAQAREATSSEPPPPNDDDTHADAEILEAAVASSRDDGEDEPVLEAQVVDAGDEGDEEVYEGEIVIEDAAQVADTVEDKALLDELARRRHSEKPEDADDEQDKTPVPDELDPGMFSDDSWM